MNKKLFSLIASLGVIFLLNGCSGTSQETTAQTTPGMPQLNVSEMTADERLAIGTLKLEGTDLAVDKEQATTLLPLWKAVRVLKTDDTISTQEMDALYQQIRNAMTQEQVKAIDAMTFKSEDVNQLMASLGVGFASEAGQAGNSAQNPTGPGDMGFTMEFSTGDGTTTNRRSGSSGGFPPGGGAPPSGGGPSGGAMPEGGAMMFDGRPEDDADQTGQNTGQAIKVRMSNMFIEPLIRLLRERISS